MTKKQSPVEKFMALSEEEKRRQTEVFDREFAADAARPMKTEERAHWSKAKAAAKKRLRGRSATGEGVQVISLSVEKQLLRKTDQVRARLHQSRAQIIAEALRRYLPTLSS